MLLKSGDILGGCRVVEMIGEGGMGQVYRAHQQALNRVVALKILPSSGPDGELERRFDREIRAHIPLSHPNLVKVFDAGRDRGFRYLVLELIDGATLRCEIRGANERSWDEAAGMSRQILEALAYLESVGLIHRDLKPENILIDRHRVIKIADFGLVKSDAATVLTQADQVVRTLKYLAPELLRGELPSAKVDVYAAGLILYELLTGKLPYSGSDTGTWMQAILHAKGTALRRVRTDLGKAQEDFLNTLLEKDAAKRPAAAAALLLLDKVCTDSTRQAQPIESAARPGSGRGPWLAGGLGAFAIVALGLLVPSFKNSHPIPAAGSSVSASVSAGPIQPIKRAPVSWVRLIPRTLPVEAPVLPHWQMVHAREGEKPMTLADWEAVYSHNKTLESDEEPDTLLALAVHHGRGLGVPRDIEKAKHLLIKSARLGNGFAMLEMGYDPRFARGPDGKAIDRETFERVAWDWIRDRAEEGVAAAQIDYGRWLLNEKNRPRVGLLLLERAAKNGHTAAMESLGIYFNNPEESPRDQQQAIQWFQRGVELGDPVCMGWMAWIIQQGKGVPRDIEAARGLYLRGYALGEPWAAYQLGLIYLEGKPSSADIKEADTWFRRSLELCHRSAFSDGPLDSNLEQQLAERGHSRKSTSEVDASFVGSALED